MPQWTKNRCLEGEGVVQYEKLTVWVIIKKKKKLSKHTPNLDVTLKNTKLLLQLNTKVFFLNPGNKLQSIQNQIKSKHKI